MRTSVSVFRFETFFICTLDTSKVTICQFSLNGGLHAVSVGKPSEVMSNFWMVRFLKSESEPIYGIPHTPKTTTDNRDRRQPAVKVKHDVVLIVLQLHEYSLDRTIIQQVAMLQHVMMHIRGGSISPLPISIRYL